jgi:predicted metal-dependent phosphoesterase TrpH
MIKIDLHIHTNCSPGARISVASLLKAARENGLDAIGICDRDIMSAVREAKKNAGRIMIIPGMEITCRQGFHIIGLFLEESVASTDIFQALDEIHAQGGLVMLPHPFRPATGLLHARYKAKALSGEETGAILRKIDIIEAVNYRCSLESNWETDKYLHSYPNIPQVAVSDAYCPDEIGKAFLILEDARLGSVEELKTALLKTSGYLRYEAYSPKNEIMTQETETGGLKRRLIWKAGEFLRRRIPIAERISFRKSSKKPKKKIAEQINGPRH